MEHERVPEPEPAPIMSVLRGTEQRTRTGRITPRHLNARDDLLDKILQARVAAERLEQIERAGDAGDPIQSPRYPAVRTIRTGLDSLRERLDRVYV